MPFLSNWEDFEKAAEKIYLADPIKSRYSMKYIHHEGHLVVKVTDNVTCVMYKVEYSNDLRKIEKFVSNLMRHMASQEQG